MPKTRQSDVVATGGPRLLRRAAVEHRTGLARSTIYDHMKRGTFPLPVEVSPHVMRWIESEIDQWIEDRITAGRGAAA